MSVGEEQLVVRALRTKQGEDIDVFAFFLPGGDLLRIADISRVRRDPKHRLHGFQRKEIRHHVQGIVDFLDAGAVLFPNAIILAISPRAQFTGSRGPRPAGLIEAAQPGTLRIPAPRYGAKAAWIVDGQQRSIALSEARNKSLPVPVVAFVSQDLSVHREQFILVNKARPLPSRLINELLPEVDTILPRDLAPRKIPSELCNKLNTTSTSPFYRLIRRPSDDQGEAVVIDNALITAIRASIGSPLGALAPYKASASAQADILAMYRTLVSFWSAVKDTFPEAWGKPPTESRLMHSAGIQAMGCLMDRIMSRAPGGTDGRLFAAEALGRIAPHCCWIRGRWPDMGREWNDIQNIARDVRLLSDQLARLDHAHSFAKVA